MRSHCIIAPKNPQNSSERALQLPVVYAEPAGWPMDDAVVRRESAVEYFKELVEGALAHQRIVDRRADGVLRRAIC